MPNRILKESICVSESVDALNWFEEVLFYRLIVNCDDYGRFDGRPAVIKARLFPLKERLTAKDVESALKTLAEVGIVRPYKGVDGKPYLSFPNWTVHQNIRAKKSKYPAPAGNVIASDSKCNQMKSNVPVLENPNPNPNPNAEEKKAVKPPKHTHGEYSNVMLTDEELEKLKSEFPDWETRINRLSGYIASTGRSYKSHYATIREWAKKDKQEQKTATAQPQYQQKPGNIQPSGNLGQAELEAINRVMHLDFGED